MNDVKKYGASKGSLKGLLEPKEIVRGLYYEYEPSNNPKLNQELNRYYRIKERIGQIVGERKANFVALSDKFAANNRRFTEIINPNSSLDPVGERVFEFLDFLKVKKYINDGEYRELEKAFNALKITTSNLKTHFSKDLKKPAVHIHTVPENFRHPNFDASRVQRTPG